MQCVQCSFPMSEKAQTQEEAEFRRGLKLLSERERSKSALVFGVGDKGQIMWECNYHLTDFFEPAISELCDTAPLSPLFMCAGTLLREKGTRKETKSCTALEPNTDAASNSDSDGTESDDEGGHVTTAGDEGSSHVTKEQCPTETKVQNSLGEAENEYS